MLPIGRIAKGDAGEVLATWPDASVDVVVTSPPFWGLRDYGHDGQIGLEDTFDAYLERLLVVFAEVRRVLSPHGSLWLELGDSYVTSRPGNARPDHSGTELRGTRGKQAFGAAGEVASKRGVFARPVNALDPYRSSVPGQTLGPPGSMGGGRKLGRKQLVGVPWRVAFALQAADWILRSDIVWQKTNPIPESVRDRPTRCHTYIFQMTRRAHRYFFDAAALREPVTGGAHPRGAGVGPKAAAGARSTDGRQNASYAAAVTDLVEERNGRSVWTFPTEPYPGAHYAVFPRELARRCIRAGSSPVGVCPQCRAPWIRSEHSELRYRDHREDDARRRRNGFPHHEHWTPSPEVRRAWRTVGWQPTCEHGLEPTPSVVLDPFAGSGTTGLVAYEEGRVFVGVDLAGGDADLGGHTAHDRIRAAQKGQTLGEHLAGQGALFDAGREVPRETRLAQPSEGEYSEDGSEKRGS